jgi:hypothetical protein
MFGVRPITGTKEQVDEIEKRNSIFRACFSTPAGREVLAYLEKRYLSKPVCVIDNVYWGYLREGQNDVVRNILSWSKEK